MQAKKSYSDEDLTEMGARLREAMTEANYSQTALERAAGLGKGYLVKLLYGDKQRISLDHLHTLERLLGVTSLWLSHGELPKRYGGPLPPQKQAAADARRDGIPEEIIAHVTRRFALEGKDWSFDAWYRLYASEWSLARRHPEYREQLQRVTMDGNDDDFRSLAARLNDSENSEAPKSAGRRLKPA